MTKQKSPALNQFKQDDEQHLLTKDSKSDDVAKREATDPQESKLGVRDTALALVASGVGGELIAMPYAISRLGIYLGFAAIIGIGLLSLFSSMMYLKVKDTIPGNAKSAYEMAHVLFGRPALFVVCVT